MHFIVLFVILASIVTAATGPDSEFTAYARMQAAGLSDIPIEAWPKFMPGEGLLHSERLEVKYGASELQVSEFGGSLIPIRHVQKLAPGIFRIGWEPVQVSSIFLPRARWQAEAERMDLLRLFLRQWGELRPVGLAVGEDFSAEGDDPMVGSQTQHQLMRTSEFQTELARRPNRKPWTVVIMDSGCRHNRDCPTLDPRSKSFVEGSADTGDQGADQDRASHGTRVSEIAAGVWYNGFGGHGTANVKTVLMLKVLFAFPVGADYKAVGSEADMIRAIEYLRLVLRSDEKVAVNISWSLLAAFWGFDEAMRSMYDRALFVTSAGNIGQDANPNPQFPCVFEMPNNACTTGVELDGSLRSAAKRGSAVRVAALGGGVVTSFGSGSGTSYAVPQVVGIAAELGGESLNLKPSDLLNFMRSGGVAVQNDSFGIMRVNPLGALVKIRQAYPLMQPPPANKPPVMHSHPPPPAHHERHHR